MLMNNSIFALLQQASNSLWLFVSTGTYLTHEAKGAEDAPDADTAIINAEGNHVHAEEKKEYFI